MYGMAIRERKNEREERVGVSLITDIGPVRAILNGLLRNYIVRI